MSSLIPIPPHSGTAQDIARMETVLRTMREAARVAGCADRFAVHDVSGGNRHVKLSELYTTGEGQWDWQEFYHYYGVAWRSTRWGDPQVGRHARGPQWVKLCSEDRLAWGHALPALLTSLEGLAVSVTSSTSWRWDRENTRPKGQPRYVPVYEVLICLTTDERRLTDSAALADSLLGRHCMAEHPLAGQHLFDWQEDVLGSLLFSSYGWTKDGFQTRFDRKAAMEDACGSLFHELPHQVQKQGKGPATSWTVTVDLTQAPVDFQVRLLAETE